MNEHPRDQRQQSVNVLDIHLESVGGLERLLDRVEWTRPDVAIDDAECGERKHEQPLAARVRFGMLPMRGLFAFGDG